MLGRFKKFEIENHNWSPNSLIGIEEVENPNDPTKVKEKRIFLIQASQSMGKMEGDKLVMKIKTLLEKELKQTP